MNKNSVNSNRYKKLVQRKLGKKNKIRKNTKYILCIKKSTNKEKILIIKLNKKYVHTRTYNEIHTYIIGHYNHSC